MAQLENLTEKLVKVQSIDYVEIFGQSIQKLKDMLKIEREIKLPIGSTIKTYVSTVTLDGTKVAKGDIIPLSKVERKEGDPIELEWNKKRKAVAAEDVQKYGFENAIATTDKLLLKEQQKEVKKSFFAQLAKGTTTVTGTGLQASFAQAWGSVATKFEDDDISTIAFVNPMDVADYLATANITVQEAFGLRYIENFMGVDVAVISTSVPAKTLYATAADNLVLAYADLASGELAKVFDFVMDETGIIGVTHDIDKTRLTAETVTASATVLFAERLDGIVKVTIKAAGEAGK